VADRWWRCEARERGQRGAKLRKGRRELGRTFYRPREGGDGAAAVGGGGARWPAINGLDVRPSLTEEGETEREDKRGDVNIQGKSRWGRKTSGARAQGKEARRREVGDGPDG
jgi:hypothetical protein